MIIEVSFLRKKLTLHPSLLLWFSVLFYMKPEVLFPFILSVLVHEAGHIFCLAGMGIPIHSISISAFGAAIETDPLSYKAMLRSAAAGPITSLSSSVVFQNFPLFSQYNLILGLFNLLPLRALDGGKMLHSGLMQITEERIADTISNIISIATLVIGFLMVLLYTYRNGVSPLLFCLFLVILLKNLALLYLPTWR